MTTLADLYCEVGSALHKAQLAEYSIVSIYLLLSRTGAVCSTRELEESYWSKKTLGQLLKPVIDSDLLPEDAKLFLATFLNARNHLAHSFFLSSSEVHTFEGVNSLLREVAAMEEVFDRAFQFFERLLGDLACPYGIAVEDVKAHARVAVLNLKGSTECKG